VRAYGPLARRYDALTADVDYAAWADYLEKHFSRQKKPVSTVLDLACGTGSLTWLLAERGYEMIGVDQSAEMLAIAAQKRGEGVAIPPIFLQQPMEKLDLYGTVDACVCCLDSVNYITRPALLRRAFQRVHLFLEPGGLFLFDVNTPEKLKGLDGGVFVDETEDVYCLWQARFSEKRRLATYEMDLFFKEEGGLWRREAEEHREYAYTLEELTGYLREAGFATVRAYGDKKLRPPKSGEGRVFFAAGKGEG